MYSGDIARKVLGSIFFAGVGQVQSSRAEAQVSKDARCILEVCYGKDVLHDGRNKSEVRSS